MLTEPDGLFFCPLFSVSFQKHLQEVAEIKKNVLSTFLAWWYAWTSQAIAVPLAGREAGEASKQQEGPPPQQAPCPDKEPCKNFFWKTFSCK